MLDKVLRIVYRVIIIITLLVVLGRLLYRPYILTYDSTKPVSSSNNFDLLSETAFSDFIYRNSVNVQEEADNTVGSLSIYGINVSCPIYFYEDLEKSSTDKKDIRVKTESTVENFGKGITIIQGNSSEGSPFCNLKLLSEEKWFEKVKTFNLINANEKTTVYKIFVITTKLSYEDIEGLNNKELRDLLQKETEVNLKQSVPSGNIVVLMLDTGIIDNEWLIIGGYKS